MGNNLLRWNWKIPVALLVLAGIGLTTYKFTTSTQRHYRKEVKRCLEQSSAWTSERITEKDLQNLPEPVRKYLEYVGVAGTGKVSHYSMTADGELRLNPERDWAPVDAEQMSFLSEPIRLYFIRMNIRGLGIMGLHHYESASASMVIRPLDLFTAVDARGPEMNRGETVTVFNDMCIFAPSTLIDSRIRWKEIDDLSVEGTFMNEGISVTATLYFNEVGQLVDFISDDRYYWNEDGTYDLVRWSTPVSEYREINGLNLPCRAEAVWMLEDGPFPYARFTVKDVTLNPRG